MHVHPNATFERERFPINLYNFLQLPYLQGALPTPNLLKGAVAMVFGGWTPLVRYIYVESCSLGSF